MMSVAWKSSAIGRSGQYLAGWWRESRIFSFLDRIYRIWVQTVEQSTASRLLPSYQLPESRSSFGDTSLAALRRGWSRLMCSTHVALGKAASSSSFSRYCISLAAGWRDFPVAGLGAALFGFVTLFFSLSFFTSQLRGLNWIILAAGLFLLAAACLFLPASYARGSLLQKASPKPFQESRHVLSLLVMGVLLGILSFLSSPLLVFGALAMVAFILWALRHPEAGLYAVAAYPLFDFAIRGYLPGIVGKIWSFALLALIFGGIFLQLARDRQRRFFFTAVSLALLLFLLWGTLSLVQNKVSFDVGFEGLRAILQTSLFFLAALNAVRTRAALRTVFIVLAVVLILISLYAAYQVITQVPVKPGWVDKDFEQDITTRAFSMFPSPNALSGYLVLFIPLFLVLFLEEHKIPAKLLFLLAFALSMAALLFTLTRGAWLALAIGLLLLGILHVRRVLVILVVAALLLPFFPQFNQRFATLISGEYWAKSASTGRLYRWEIAGEIASANPLFGSGPGTFGGAVAYRAGYWPGVYADNYYLKTLAETGYGGLALFLLMLLALLWEGFRRTRALADRSLRNISWAIAAGLVSFLVHMFTENLWEEPALAVAFWLLAGLWLALPLLERKTSATCSVQDPDRPLTQSLPSEGK